MLLPELRLRSNTAWSLASILLLRAVVSRYSRGCILSPFVLGLSKAYDSRSHNLAVRCCKFHGMTMLQEEASWARQKRDALVRDTMG